MPIYGRGDWVCISHFHQYNRKKIKNKKKLKKIKNKKFYLFICVYHIFYLSLHCQSLITDDSSANY